MIALIIILMIGIILLVIYSALLEKDNIELRQKNWKLFYEVEDWKMKAFINETENFKLNQKLSCENRVNHCLVETIKRQEKKMDKKQSLLNDNKPQINIIIDGKSIEEYLKKGGINYDKSKFTTNIRYDWNFASIYGRL